MKDRREYIVRKAMETYLLNGYDNVSISDLQYAMDIGRGTMYYYFPDQDSLFQTCMEHYFLGPKYRALSAVPEKVSVSEMINAMLTYLGSLEKALHTFDNQNINTSNAVNLMCTAYSRFPKLYRKAKRIYQMEMVLWRRAIRNDMAAGLIRHDIDVELTATMFTHIKDGYDSGDSRVTMDFTLFPQKYNFLYNLLKTH